MPIAPLVPSIADYFRFDFASNSAHTFAGARLRAYLVANADFAAHGPGPVVWSSPPTAPTPALYLSAGAVLAANRALVMLGPATFVRASKLPADVVLVFGDAQDLAGPG